MSLSADIAALVGADHLYFYDAISPIVLAESHRSCRRCSARRAGAAACAGAGDASRVPADGAAAWTTARAIT